MLEKTKAIVLHTLRYGESSLIIQCFTEKWGRQSYLMKGVRKSKKNNRSNLFQPLFLLQMDIYFKPNRDLQWIKEFTLLNPQNSLQQDITKRAQALFITEVLSKTLREEEQNISLFQFLEGSLNYLEALDTAFASFHLLFMFQLTRYLGFEPQNNYSVDRPYFNLNMGMFSGISNGTDIFHEKDLGKYWKSCFLDSYTVFNDLVNNHYSRNMFLDSLLEFYRIHMENFDKINSVEILRTIFDK